MSPLKILGFIVSHLVPPAIAIGIVAPCIIWWMDDTPPLTVYGHHLQTPVVDRLGNLAVTYDAEFHRRCTGVGRRTFVDSTHFRMPINPYYFRFGIAANGDPVPLGKRMQFPVAASVPDATAPGRTTYQNVTDFYCNPLQLALRGTRFDRHITFRYPVIEFTVSPDRSLRIIPPKTLFKPVYEYPDALEEMPSTTPPSPEDDDAQRIGR